MIKKHQFSREIKVKIKSLYVYDNHHGFLACLCNLFWIILAVCLAEFSPWLLPLSLLLIGSRQRALATLLHESAHGALCRSKNLEKFIGTWCSGYLIFQGWEAYRQSHILNHHYKLGDYNHDPDYKFYRESGVFNKMPRIKFVLSYFVGPIFFINCAKSLKYLVINRLANKTSGAELVAIFFCQCILIASITMAVGFKGYLIYWLLPYFTTFQALTWFIELSEHYPMIAEAESDIQASRNRFSHSIEHFLTAMHGENFHLIHHLFPAIPYWNLKKAHSFLMNDREYAKRNSAFGGIFISSNSVPSMWQRIFLNYKSQ